MSGVKLAIACVILTFLWFALCRVLYLGSDSATQMRISLHDYPKWWKIVCLVGAFLLLCSVISLIYLDFWFLFKL